MHSAIYIGHVWHRRASPKLHEFNYRVYMAYLDLGELDSVLTASRWWGRTNTAVKKASIISRFWPPVQFRREDYFRDFDQPLDKAIRHWVLEQTGETLGGPIRVLANLRVFGFIINPIVCYYLFDKSGTQLRYVIAEVTNTPWRERIQYLLPVNDQGTLEGFKFKKGMHVSPFHGMDMEYLWSSNLPGSSLGLQIENIQQGVSVFQASMKLQRREINSASLRSVFTRFPFITLKVAAAIYWQALKLFLKRVPLLPHPKSTVRKR